MVCPQGSCVFTVYGAGLSDSEMGYTQLLGSLETEMPQEEPFRGSCRFVSSESPAGRRGHGHTH